MRRKTYWNIYRYTYVPFTAWRRFRDLEMRVCTQKYARIASPEARESDNEIPSGAPCRFRRANITRSYFRERCFGHCANGTRSGKNVAIREMPVRISEMRQLDISLCTGCPATLARASVHLLTINFHRSNLKLGKRFLFLYFDILVVMSKLDFRESQIFTRVGAATAKFRYLFTLNRSLIISLSIFTILFHTKFYTNRR